MSEGATSRSVGGVISIAGGRLQDLFFDSALRLLGELNIQQYSMGFIQMHQNIVTGTHWIFTTQELGVSWKAPNGRK